MSRNDDDTRTRLLRAGRKIFAEQGLAEARVRDICQLAGANVAAVNYHFGNKEKFYIAVLGDQMCSVRARHPLDQGLGPNARPEDRLRTFVRALLAQILSNDDAHSARISKLILLEMVQPSAHVGLLIKEHMQPVVETLRSIVRKFLPEAADNVVSQCTAAIMAQFSNFHFDLHIRDSLGLALEKDGIDQVAESIVEFSRGGIERLRALPGN